MSSTPGVDSVSLRKRPSDGVIDVPRGIGFHHDFPYDPRNRADPQRAFDSLQDYGDRSRASAKNHAGIWHDLVVRRRKTEVEPILGEMVRRGEAVGVDVRLNDALVRMVHEIEDGTRTVNWQNFDELEARAQEQGKWFPF